MLKYLKKLSILVCLVMVIPYFIGLLTVSEQVMKVNALDSNNKERLETVSGVIGINSTPAFIKLQYANTNNEYIFKSKNESVCKVDPYSMGWCRMEGVSSGKTEIVVTNSTTGKQIGVYDVTVKGSSVIDKDIEVGINNTVKVGQCVLYRNRDAVYEMSMSNEKIGKIYLNEYEYIYGDKIGALGGLLTEDFGVTKISIMEDLNGIKKNLGSFNLKVKKAKLTKTFLNLYPNRSSINFREYVQYLDMDKTLEFKSEDKNIISNYSENEFSTVDKVGTTNILVQQVGKDGEIDVIGKIKVQIGATLVKKEINIGKNSIVNIYTLTNGRARSAKYVYEIADQKILKRNGDRLMSLKLGTTKVTIKEVYGGKSRTIGKVNVKVVDKPPRVKVDKLVVEILYGGEYSKWLHTEELIEFFNRNADYMYTSNNNDIVKIYNKPHSISQEIKIVKPGTVSVTVTEKYNGKIKTIGKFKLIAKKESR